MPGFCAILISVLFISLTESQLYYSLTPQYNNEPFYRNPLDSFASRVPGSSINSVTNERSGSNLPAVQPPQVLLNYINSQQPPQAAAPAPSFMDSFFSMGSSPASGAAAGNSMPVSAGIKQMVTKWATQLGHKAYYEAHGCVDPTTTLHGRHSQMASMAMMLGCNSMQASEVCELAQVAQSGAQNANMRLMMDMLMPKQIKTMLEKCLSPSTLTNSLMGANSVFQAQMGGLVPPTEAAGASPVQSTPVDCSSISQMLMMNSAAEGLLSPESLEQIGIMRNKYFKMTCQENVIFGSLPYRMCCPGYVRPPTMQEAMMLKGMGAGA